MVTTKYLFCNSHFEMCSSFLPYLTSVDKFWFLTISVMAEDHPSFKNQLILHGKFCMPRQGLALGHLIVCTRVFWPQLWCQVCHQSQFFCPCLCRLTVAAHTSVLLPYWALRSHYLFASHFSCMECISPRIPVLPLHSQLPLPEWAKTSLEFQVLL